MWIEPERLRELEDLNVYERLKSELSNQESFERFRKNIVVREDAKEGKETVFYISLQSWQKSHGVAATCSSKDAVEWQIRRFYRDHLLDQFRDDSYRLHWALWALAGGDSSTQHVIIGTKGHGYNRSLYDHPFFGGAPSPGLEPYRRKAWVFPTKQAAEHERRYVCAPAFTQDLVVLPLAFVARYDRAVVEGSAPRWSDLTKNWMPREKSYRFEFPDEAIS